MIRERTIHWLPQIFFLLIFAAGAFLRFYHLDDPGFWVDEIVGLRQSSNVPVLANDRKHADDPEHGPLFHWILSMAGSTEASEYSARLPFAIAGSITIPLLYFAGGGGSSVGVRLLAATLLAFSPIHIYYSRDARPYSLVICAFVIALCALFRMRSQSRSRWWALLFVLTCVILLLLSAQGTLYITVLMVVAVVELLLVKNIKRRKRFISGIGLGIGLLFLYFLLYGSPLDRPAVLEAPDFSHTFAAQMLQGLLVSHSESDRLSPRLLVPVILMLTGSAAVLRKKEKGIHWLVIAALGFCLPWIALVIRNHWINVRYLLPALPGFLYLQAIGIEQWTETAGIRKVKQGWIVPAVLSFCMLAVCFYQFPGVRASLTGKADWRGIAIKIRENSRRGDLVIASNQWTYICLSHHLPRVGASVELRQATGSLSDLQSTLAKKDFSLLVSGGFHSRSEIRNWMGQHPSIYFSPVEMIRISIYPDRVFYLKNRLPERIAIEQEEILYKEGGDLVDATPGFLLDGWGPAERTPQGDSFRWITGKKAEAFFPVKNRVPKRLLLTVAPFEKIDDQKVTIFLNGTVLGIYPLARGLNNLVIDLPEKRLKQGIQLLDFECSQQLKPSETIDGSRDSRDLSVAFYSMILHLS